LCFMTPKSMNPIFSDSLMFCIPCGTGMAPL
jgi:hypothetical protein